MSEPQNNIETLTVNDRLLSAVSYFSSIAGVYDTFTPAQTVEGEDVAPSWFWHSDASQKPLEPGYWLHLQCVKKTMRVVIYEEHIPDGLIYLVVGYCAYHNLDFEITY